MSIRLSDVKLSPDAFAAVMATGILSVAARDHHYVWISNALGFLATMALVVLSVLTVAATATMNRVLPWDTTDPQISLSLYTFVAACTVLANRMSSHRLVLLILGAVAAIAWLGLTLITVRNLSVHRGGALRAEVRGSWLLFSVATSGLAIVAAKLASHTARHLWLVAAVATWVVALAIYLAMTSLMLRRMVSERLDRDGFEPDSWILMGSLAIATVAGHYIYQQTGNGLAASVQTAMAVAWLVATIWIPPLIYFVLKRLQQRPQMLKLTSVWWTLVFPLGMYSVATHLLANQIQLRPLETIALAFFWDALSVWLVIVIAGILRMSGRLVAGRNLRHDVLVRTE